MSTVTEDRRRDLLSRVSIHQREVESVYRDVLTAPSDRLSDLEGEVQRLAGQAEGPPLPERVGS